MTAPSMPGSLDSAFPTGDQFVNFTVVVNHQVGGDFGFWIQEEVQGALQISRRCNAAPGIQPGYGPGRSLGWNNFGLDSNFTISMFCFYTQKTKPKLRIVGSARIFNLQS